MKDKINILCPEYVPFENKGEEAIIQGTIDVLFTNPSQCIYHVVDLNSKTYYEIGNVCFHPGTLFFATWRYKEFNIGLSWNQLYSSVCSLLRNVLNKFFPWWISKPHKQARNLKLYFQGRKRVPYKYKESIDKLKKIDYIIAGHNGGLDEYVCHIVNELHKVGIVYGIFGSCMKPNLNNKILLRIYEKTFANSSFNIVRNPIGYNWAISNFPNITFNLKPDPAFGMYPSNKVHIDRLIEHLKLKDFFQKQVIMFTTAEPAPIARHSFDKYMGANKINAHRQFLAEILKELHSTLDVNFLFLPHTIGPDSNMDDRLISKDIIRKAKLKDSPRVKLLIEDLSAKELKGLIGRADFLIAERVHSVIGAIGVNTPFLCLASEHDKRVRGILSMQMGLSNYLYYLNKPEVNDAINKFQSIFNRRKEVINSLVDLNFIIKAQLEEAGKIIEQNINLKGALL